MHHVSTTPFGSRPVTAGLIQAVQDANGQAPLPHINKWDVFRQVCVARHAYGLTDRDLTVLNALLTFHQGAVLGDNAPLVVFPSNRALSGRAHGMAESPLRRHLAAIAASGLVLRQDSPNAKRYAHKDRQGDIIRAFGFNLRPLLTRAAEIAHNASEAEAAQDRLKTLRTDISLMKRDALKFALYGQENDLSGDWGSLLDDLMEVHKQMRRKLGLDDLHEIADITRGLLDQITGLLHINAKEMSGSDSQNDHQLQNSNKEPYDLEPCLEKQKDGSAQDMAVAQVDSCQQPRVPLALVVKACPDLEPYADGEIRLWHELVRTAEFVRGMMGISPSGYQEACAAMGRETASIVVGCILQRVDQINSPGGYLRSLARKAQGGQFSVGPMIMALLNGRKS